MSMQNDVAPDLDLVGPESRFPTVTLTRPAPSGYLLLALEIDRRPIGGHFLESARKKEAVAILKRTAADLAGSDGVTGATAFKALMAPPGRGPFLKKRPKVPVARFDALLLAEFERPAAARAFRAGDIWRRVEAATGALARRALTLSATNVRRIAPVDHSRDGVFLFNFFYADRLDVNLAIWEHVAGWYQDQTGLDNSTLLLPDTGQDCPYTVVNHCRWDRLRDLMRPMLLDLGFHSYVSDNFARNKTAPMPMLYRLA